MEIDIDGLCRRIKRECRDGYLIARSCKNTAGKTKWFMWSPSFTTTLSTKICWDSFHSAFLAAHRRGVRCVTLYEAEKYLRRDCTSFLPFLYPAFYDVICSKRMEVV